MHSYKIRLCKNTTDSCVIHTKHKLVNPDTTIRWITFRDGNGILEWIECEANTITHIVQNNWRQRRGRVS
jgi:hypothetical protein